MSQEKFEEFRRLVLRDLSLQEKLRDFTKLDPFVNRVVELGRDLGLEFSRDDVAEAMRANKRLWIERWI